MALLREVIQWKSLVKFFSQIGFGEWPWYHTGCMAGGENFDLAHAFRDSTVTGDGSQGPSGQQCYAPSHCVVCSIAIIGNNNSKCQCHDLTFCL